MEEERISILDKYIDEHSLMFDVNSESFQSYYRIADSILDYTNFLLFPIEEIKTTDDGKTINRLFKCNLIVEDNEFWNGIKTYPIEIDWKTLQNFDSLKSYLWLQVPTIKINTIKGKLNKDELCSDIQRWLLEWFKLVFGCKTAHKLNRLWFSGENNEVFIFNNWVLDIQSGDFTPGEYNLVQDTSINITFPLEQMEGLTLEESLRETLSLKKYISSNDTVSSIVVGYLIAWIFRNEIKLEKNEFPFLGIQAITNAGKTSLLNFLSWVCGFNRNTILGTNDSEFSFEVWMDSLSARYYYFDEIQKASRKLLKYIQAAYNSGENHKGWWNWNWWKVHAYKKDCNLICCGEVIPDEEEALLNRFIILDTKEPFLIKKNVRDEEEFQKYKSLTGKEVNDEYLTTNQIQKLAKDFYRPRFLNILRNKRNIDFKKYYAEATRIVENVAKELWTIAPDTRVLNNLATAVAGYMVPYWNNVDEEEIMRIVSEYFVNFLDYKRDSYISWRAVSYITDNIWDYCSWTDKVRWVKKNCPMVYIKSTQRENGIWIQIPTISRDLKSKLDSPLKAKHIEQQIRGAFEVPNSKNRPLDIARWLAKMQVIFIDYAIVKNNALLKQLWDVTLDYLGGHIQELKKLRDDSSIRYAMADSTLEKLIEEMEETYSTADFFDKVSFSKEIVEEHLPF